jgi:hypothetical protein
MHTNAEGGDVDLSPTELAVLAEIVCPASPARGLWLTVRADEGGAWRDAGLMLAIFGVEMIAAMTARGLIETWLGLITLTPIAAETLGIEIAERIGLESDEVFEPSRIVKGKERTDEWVPRETLVEEPYWALSPDPDPEHPRVWPDAIDAIRRRLPLAPTTVVLPRRRYECPLPFPDLIASASGVASRHEPVKASAGSTRRERRQAKRAG